MGNAVTITAKTTSRWLLRWTRRFNVEARSQKILMKDKPEKAPLYDANVKEMERLAKEHPELVKNIHNRHENLNENLKHVYVKSLSDNPEIKALEPAKQPKSNIDFYYSNAKLAVAKEEEIPIGKYTISQAADLVLKHQKNSEIYDIRTICKTYQLKPKVAKAILKHFTVYDVYVPDQQELKGRFRRIAEDMMPKMENIEAEDDAALAMLKIEKKKLERDYRLRELKRLEEEEAAKKGPKLLE